MNPGGKDAATTIGAAVAGTVRASAEQPWFTDPPALLVSVARAAERWEPPLRNLVVGPPYLKCLEYYAK